MCKAQNVHWFGFTISKEKSDPQEWQYAWSGMVVASVEKVSDLTDWEIAWLIVMFRKQKKQFIRTVAFKYISTYFQKLVSEWMEAEKIAATFATEDRENVFERSAHAIVSDSDEEVCEGCGEVHGKHPFMNLLERIMQNLPRRK